MNEENPIHLVKLGDETKEYLFFAKPIEFKEMTEETSQSVQAWFASLTKAEVIEYAAVKLMPVAYMLKSWKAARKAQRAKYLHSHAR